MSVASFIPEIWSAQLLVALRKQLVYAALANRDYEGDIAQAGDTVHITSVGRPTVSTYTPGPGGTTITPEALQTADRTLVVSQAEYFAFAVDDVDMRQMRGNIMDQAANEAAFALADSMDQYVAAKYIEASAPNQIGTTSILTGDQAYTQLTKLHQKLDEANVPTAERWVVVPPWFYALLLDSNRIAANPAATAVGEAAIIRGYIGELAGFSIFMSNNAPVPGANRNIVLAGTRMAITLAEQIPTDRVEAYRSQAAFQDVVRGLHLYGAKTVRPDAIATLDASKV